MLMDNFINIGFFDSALLCYFYTLFNQGFKLYAFCHKSLLSIPTHNPQ